ncbi:MAG TPA: hydrolase [Bryobacterales bacterium]|jgi:hypothetical protein|nr:hydrolase [Bryobacterales bacterium]
MAGGECQCPKIDLADWRDREVTLSGHQFLSAQTPIFLHVPRRLYREVEALENQIRRLGLRPAGAPLILHRDGWFWGEVLVSVDPHPRSSPEIQSFQNLFYSRVVDEPGFDAALREMPRFYRDLRAAGVGRIESMYFWYLSCPRCLIEHGARQIILLARSNKLLASESCPLMASAAAPTPRALPCGI